MERPHAPACYGGISGLQLPVPKYLLAEEFQNASRLTYYASLFNSIEINSSFYKVPQASTAAKWAASVPEDFRFTFKLWREVTHIKGLDFREADVAAFMEVISSVKDKKGCLLIQFPPGLGNEYFLQLEKLLSTLLKNSMMEWKIAVEFRNKSWYNSATYGMLEHFKAALVIQDIPKSATPLVTHNSHFIYIRFHGPTGNYRDSYSEDYLNEYAGYINEWLEEGKDVYAYFNNTAGDAINNLNTLKKLVQSGHSTITKPQS